MKNQKITRTITIANIDAVTFNSEKKVSRKETYDYSDNAKADRQRH